MALRSYSVLDIWLPSIIIIMQDYSQALNTCNFCAVYDECKYSDTFWLADRTRLFVQYTISLSSLCKLIWRHWNYKMPVRYILSSVWVRLSIFSLLFIIHYVGLCVFSLPISLVMIERIYILSYYHHQIGSMNYYPLFRVRSWNNGFRCMSFYILIELFKNLTFKIQGQSHSSRSHSRYNIPSTHIPFIPCWLALPWNTAVSKNDLENPRLRLWVRSKFEVTVRV